ncbi:MAG TPA: hybrid sensor histidine kinase/response regulator [Anaerolineae bacterium]|nr:hybrid sensor histidine kinase/response regulator [Anaerolineae bacterium]
MNIDPVLQNASILIIDDNPTNIGVVVDYLEQYEMDIMVAQDGETGISIAVYAHPDIILLDVMMPGMDGFETCRQLKDNSITQDIPVIFMTARAHQDDKVKGFEVGAADYITKPIQQKEALARITNQLKIRQVNTYLQEQNQRLADLNASKDKFFSIISHDLRGPFNSLIGLSQLIAKQYETMTSEEIGELAKHIHNTAKASYNLLQNLLTWARLQRGQVTWTPEMVDLQRSSQRIIQLLTSAAHHKQITLNNDVPADTFVYADQEMLHTILRNLVANAIKFTPHDGSVTVAISAEPTPDWLAIHIVDTGVGIAPEDQEKLFKTDIHHTTKGTEQEDGSGLGLIICYEMIQRHRGNIWVDSKIGEGTTFSFTLPTVATVDGVAE